MNFEDLLNIYEQYKQKFGINAFKHVSSLLNEAKVEHKKDWEQIPTKGGDHEQSWRAFKGKNLEKLVLYIIKDQVEELGLKLINGNTLERTEKLTKEQGKVKRNLLVDFGEYGCHLPDVDIVIFDPRDCEVLAVISSKVTLRERIAQTGYWKIKLNQDKITKHIKVFFVTPDEDGTLNHKMPFKKGRAIVEVDTDGSYVMTQEVIEESARVKQFDRFIDDLRKVQDEKKNKR